MNLRPENVLKKFQQFPFYSQDGRGDDAEVIVKYFNPFGAGTWLITEAEQQDDGEWLLYGLCHIFEWEWGYVSLEELESLHIIEIDEHCGEHPTIKELTK